MRKLLLSAAVFGLISSQAQLAIAQANAASANATRYGIAVVDIGYVFQKLPQFKTQIDALKKEGETADGQLKAERDRILALEEQRNALKPGSPEFKTLDETIARDKAAFGIKQGTIRRDMLEKEAAVYLRTYNEVSSAVKYFAQQNNIGLVLRFNGESIDPTNYQRDDVMRLMMQPIIHQNDIDITPDVIALLSRGAGAAVPAAVTPTATAPRPPAR